MELCRREGRGMGRRRGGGGESQVTYVEGGGGWGTREWGSERGEEVRVRRLIWMSERAEALGNAAPRGGRRSEAVDSVGCPRGLRLDLIIIGRSRHSNACRSQCCDVGSTATDRSKERHCEAPRK